MLFVLLQEKVPWFGEQEHWLEMIMNGDIFLSVVSLIPQIFLWMSEQTMIDVAPLLVTWAELTGHVASLFTRLWEWSLALFAGNPFFR